jgi:hypothetical protein
MLNEFLLYLLFINYSQYSVAVIRRQLRKLPKEWVQEWQNLYARRFVMHANTGEGFRLLEIFIFVSLSLCQFHK